MGGGQICSFTHTYFERTWLSTLNPFARCTYATPACSASIRNVSRACPRAADTRFGASAPFGCTEQQSSLHFMVIASYTAKQAIATSCGVSVAAAPFSSRLIVVHDSPVRHVCTIADWLTGWLADWPAGRRVVSCRLPLVCVSHWSLVALCKRNALWCHVKRCVQLPFRTNIARCTPWDCWRRLHWHTHCPVVSGCDKGKRQHGTKAIRSRATN